MSAAPVHLHRRWSEPWCKALEGQIRGVIAKHGKIHRLRFRWFSRQSCVVAELTVDGPWEESGGLTDRAERDLRAVTPSWLALSLRVYARSYVRVQPVVETFMVGDRFRQRLACGHTIALRKMSAGGKPPVKRQCGECSQADRPTRPESADGE